MKKDITANNYNRLSICLTEKFGDEYEDALGKLSSMTMNLECGHKIATSSCLQIALLTAINTGKRAFLGGVNVLLPIRNISCLIPHRQGSTLDHAITEAGAILVANIVLPDENSFKLNFGIRAENNSRCLEVVCNSWQGGIATFNQPVTLEENNSLPMGGVAAGAIAVGIAFFKCSKIDIACGDFCSGISLWRPDLHWLDPEAAGSDADYLPQKIWLLGLGHLGQGYLWNLSFLPYKNPKEVLLLLQDPDKVVDANYSAGLLTETDNIGIHKTRVCSAWLESLGFETKITERRFNENTIREGDEPYLALCGFDNAESRSILENAGFSLVIEAGLGGSLSLFDDIIMHTFPNTNTLAKKVWNLGATKQDELHRNVLRKMEHLKEHGCGMLPVELAGKAISSAFVGALAGAMVTAEMIRATNCGKGYEFINSQIRNLKNSKAFLYKSYTGETAINGLLEIR